MFSGLNFKTSWLLVATIWLVISCQLLAASTVSLNDNPLSRPVKTDPDPMSKLTSLVRSHQANQTETFSLATEILASLESSPSCNRLATAMLAKSCETLDNQDPTEPEIFLDRVRSMYAARLAVCELTEAGVPVPAQCSLLLPLDRSKKRRGLKDYLSRNGRPKDGNKEAKYYDDINQRQLVQCLRNLESKPQWWTSYSNGRQNAVVICSALRSHIEKAQALETYKSLVEVVELVAGASPGFISILEAFREVLRHERDVHWQAFQEVVQASQKRVFREIEQQQQTLFKNITQEMGFMFHTFMSKIYMAEIDIDNLNEHTGNQVAGELQRTQSNVMSQMLQENQLASVARGSLVLSNLDAACSKSDEVNSNLNAASSKSDKVNSNLDEANSNLEKIKKNIDGLGGLGGWILLVISTVYVKFGSIAAGQTAIASATLLVKLRLPRNADTLSAAEICDDRSDTDWASKQLQQELARGLATIR
ncbi:hypothetical protein FGG08_000673 [Glutinoglossum americanum]|uniref:Uncharacterized protein n=1 Tax=Glutinoglossum americanum TaxID=1670608 RepID=A0A9P8L5X4_9PEZI|nr:hypothetical protein FGG08_000673 [Glutinoglossum americanum]